MTKPGELRVKVRLENGEWSTRALDRDLWSLTRLLLLRDADIG